MFPVGEADLLPSESSQYSISDTNILMGQFITAMIKQHTPT